MRMSKKRTIVMTAAGLGVFCMVSASYAYMTRESSVVNSMEFIGSADISGTLTEPSWNPSLALMAVPGKVIPKDPRITNTSKNDVDVFALMKVEFVYTDQYPEAGKRGKTLSAKDMEQMSKLLEINYASEKDGKWIRFDGEKETDATQHFYYADVLKRNQDQAGDSTVPLFTEVVMDPAAGNHEIAAFTQIGGIDIRVSGQLVQCPYAKQDYPGAAKKEYASGNLKWSDA